MTAYRPEGERFIEKVEVRDGHWFWTATRTPTTAAGYGQFRMADGSRHAPARAAWIIFRGPTDANVQRTCDEDGCIAPSHHALVVQTIPTAKAIRKGLKDYAAGRVDAAGLAIRLGVTEASVNIYMGCGGRRRKDVEQLPVDVRRERHHANRRAATSKLTPMHVQVIRRMHDAGYSVAEIVTATGAQKSNVYVIAKRRLSWKDVA